MCNDKYFKCRCVNFLYQRVTGCDLMSGGYFHHMSIVHSLPCGLNREFFRIYDLDLWFDSDFVSGGVLVKHRVGGKYDF